MADIQSGSSDNGRKKKAPKVDMTAMVDVAFLLLTFFVLTTTLSNPGGMDIIKPPVGDEIGKQNEKNILTLILSSDDQVYYYHGMPDGPMEKTDFGEGGLRQLIFDHLNRHPKPCSEGVARDCWDPIFILKPNEDCVYRNVVDALDELRLTQAPKFCYAPMTSGDSLLLENSRVR